MVSIVLAVTLSFFVMRLIEVAQQRTPFETVQSFDIEVSESSTSKPALIGELSQIVDQYDVTLIKSTADPDDYQSRKNIFWFGTNPPYSENPSTDNGIVNWFDSSLEGELLPASSLGDQPLSGTYYASQSPAFAEALRNWAQKSGIAIFTKESPSGGEVTFVLTTSTGIGNVTVSVVLLLIASLIVWFVVQARSRSLRLLAGFSSLQIHLQDCSQLLTNIVISLLTGFVGVAIYVEVSRGSQNTLLFLHELVTPLVITLLFLILVIFGLSVITRPTIATIAKRQIPLLAFHVVGRAVRFTAVALSLFVLPGALVYSLGSSSAAREQGVWQAFRGTVRVSTNIDVFGMDVGLLSKFDTFLKDAKQQDSLMLSYVVDAGIKMGREKLGDFDHLIITDTAFLEQVEVPAGGSSSQGSMKPVLLEDLAFPMRTFIEAQFAVITASGEPLPRGMELYVYDGPGLPGAGPGAGLGGKTVVAKHALVAVVSDPVDTFDLQGFLIPTLSSGNLFFRNGEVTRSLLAQSGIASYITSIDHISDLALDSAQALAREARLYTLAAGLVLIAIIVASMQGAHLWAGTNERRIFTLHSSGEPYRNIYRSQLRTEFTLLAVACVVGASLSFLFKNNDIQITVASIVIVAALYSISTLMAHQMAAQQAFSRAIHRKH
ncbi:MAG: hypothetical protein QM705_08765 [Ancrocorticia sp.]